MRCPKCHAENTRVLDSRDTNEEKEIRRRRICQVCQFRFTTFERVEPTSFLIIKKDNSRQIYDRKKLENGLWKACEKRPVTQDQISSLINELEEKWTRERKEVKSEQIGEDIMNKLKSLDEVAYIRFASVYRQFKDIDTFRKELQKLLA